MPVEGKVTLKDAAVRGAIERVRLSLPLGGDMTPAFRSIGRIVKTGTQLRFRQQKSPEGARWKPSQRAQRTHGQTLRLTGRLRNSLTYVADRASVAIGTNVVYGPIHQFGGLAGRGRKVVIPARPYLGASEADKLAVVDTLNDFIGGRWRGA